MTKLQHVSTNETKKISPKKWKWIHSANEMKTNVKSKRSSANDSTFKLHLVQKEHIKTVSVIDLKRISANSMSPKVVV